MTHPGTPHERAVGHLTTIYPIRLDAASLAAARHLGPRRHRHLLTAAAAAIEAGSATLTLPTAAARPAKPRAKARNPLPASPLTAGQPGESGALSADERRLGPPLQPSPLGVTPAAPGAEPGSPIPHPQTDPARAARALTHGARLARVDAELAALHLPTYTAILASLGATLAACRRMAAEGKMPRNVGALRDAARLLNAAHIDRPQP